MIDCTKLIQIYDLKNIILITVFLFFYTLWIVTMLSGNVSKKIVFIFSGVVFMAGNGAFWFLAKIVNFWFIFGGLNE